MTNEELFSAINGLNDGGSAQVIADMVITAQSGDLSRAFVRKVMEKAAEGHHQAKEFAQAGLKVISG